ncbi:hypothetical protein LCGC14_0687690, partial [marine sediment metagenome]
MKSQISFFFIFLFSLVLTSSFISAPFGYDNPTLPSLEQDLFGGKPSGFYMPNNQSLFGNFSFDGICLDGGVEIKEGVICATKLEIFNITSVNVTRQNVTVLDNFIIEGDITAEGGFFDYLGSIVNNILNIFVTDMNVSNDLIVEGNIENYGTGSFVNSIFLIDGDMADGDATLVINSQINLHSCINLTEGSGNLGFQICNDGSGTNRLVFSNSHDGYEWFWIDRDDGTINFLNDTIFTNLIVENVNSTGNIVSEGNVTASFFFGDGSQLTGINIGTQNSTAWNRSGTNVFLANIGDRVGIGTSSPQNTLNVLGDINVTENATFGNDVIIEGTLFGGSPVKISGGLNVTGNINALNNLTILDYFFLSNSYSLPPGQSKILRRNSATKAVFGVQNEIATASTDSGAGYVLNTSVAEYRIDLHSALDLNNPNDTVHHLLGANNREIWRLNPSADSSFIFESSLDSEIVMINRTGLFVTGDVNITGDLYVNSSSLYIGSEKISYAHGDDDGIMLNGSIHLEARDGVGGNIALHEGTEPLVCVSNDGGRLWYNLSNDLMWQDKNSVSKKVLLEGDIMNNSDRIISPDTLKDLTITNDTLIYNDGTTDRAVFNLVVSKIISPNGLNIIKAHDSYTQILFNDYIRLNINAGTSYLRSNDGKNRVEIKGASVALKYDSQNRVWIDNVYTEVMNPGRTGGIDIRNSAIKITLNDINRFKADDSETKILSMDGTFYARVSDTQFNIWDGSRNRIDINSVSNIGTSPDGSKKIKINNTGAYYNDVEIGTGGGGYSDKITSPNELKNLTLTNSDLIYYDGTRDRIDVTAVHSKFFSPDGDYTLLDDSQYLYNDGTRNRLEINANGGMLASQNGAHSLIVDNTGVFADGSEIVTASDVNIA